MTVMEQIFQEPPFSWSQERKDVVYQKTLTDRTEFHRQRCLEYANILATISWNQANCQGVEDIPFIPVRLFKDFDLRSVNEEEVVKTMTSSGTTGQHVSRIFLDRTNAGNQTKALAKISSDFLGNRRLPTLIIDSRAVVKNRNLFSARGAGILGFSMLGRKPVYALDENMQLDLDAIGAFLEENQGSDVFLFGFTFIIWDCFYRELKKRNIRIPLDRGILLHGGGWKKLAAQSITNEEFKTSLGEQCGIRRMYNYYGMVEQTGSIFVECEYGRIHASCFSDVIIRRPSDFSVADIGERGLVQLVSLLPTSYPGHSILTEDEGEITGIDDCPCGRLGKTFKIHGRIKNAEVRGCSDTFGR